MRKNIHAEHSGRGAVSRRRFLGAAGGAVISIQVVPRHVLGGPGHVAPSDKLSIAGIGAGGMGENDIRSIAPGNNMVALCNVDSRHATAMSLFPKAKQYRDFRKMFDEMENKIDAVIVATPDHTHAVAAMAAIKRGKHVYCEKPLAHSIHEVRELVKAARQYNVVTQMGNQGHSFEAIRLFCEWIWDGAIGGVHTIHTGCAWVESGIDQLKNVRTPEPVPEGVDWDLWLGPAQFRPYHSAYMPGSWRGWMPFGGGAVADGTCHVVDPVFWALDLGAPRTVQAEVPDYDFKTQGDACPKGEKITYEFPAKGRRGPITMHWYGGSIRIPRPEVLEKHRDVVRDGAVVIGERGTIMYGRHGGRGPHHPRGQDDAVQAARKEAPADQGAPPRLARGRPARQ